MIMLCKALCAVPWTRKQGCEGNVERLGGVQGWQSVKSLSLRHRDVGVLGKASSLIRGVAYLFTFLLLNISFQVKNMYTDMHSSIINI